MADISRRLWRDLSRKRDTEHCAVCGRLITYKQPYHRIAMCSCGVKHMRSSAAPWPNSVKCHLCGDLQFLYEVIQWGGYVYERVYPCWCTGALEVDDGKEGKPKGRPYRELYGNRPEGVQFGQKWVAYKESTNRKPGVQSYNDFVIWVILRQKNTQPQRIEIEEATDDDHIPF